MRLFFISFVLILFILGNNSCSFLKESSPFPVIKNDLKSAGLPIIRKIIGKPAEVPAVKSENLILKILGLKNEQGLIFLFGLKDNEKMKFFLGEKRKILKTIAFVKKNVGKIVQLQVETAKNQPGRIPMVLTINSGGESISPMVEQLNRGK
jgi:hypothetical protein